MRPAFQGEVQLAGWSESHNSGCKVTFWLQDAADLEAFRAMTVRKGNVAGQRMACVLVEIGDDELPVEPPPAPRKQPGNLRMDAIGLCKNHAFQAFAARGRMLPCSEEGAKQYLLATCGIGSRTELDGNSAAQAKYADMKARYRTWLIDQDMEWMTT